ncbi:MAG: type II CAAX endopeptidase family protein [Longimicrobiales bacterium]
MSLVSLAPHRRQVPKGSLMPFLLLTFGLAWGIFALFFLLPGVLEALFGPPRGSHPLFILAVYAPAVAAFTLVARRAGPGGLRRFLSRILLWRCPPAWCAFLFLGIPAVFFAGAALGGTASSEALSSPDLGSVLASMAFMMVLGPVEEFGWRGVALPLLQRRMAPVWAGTLLGFIWGLWHLPAFFLGGTPQDGWSFAPFFLGCVALSVILTPLFNASGGSILVAGFYHFQMINPLWPDAQPYDSYLFAAVAALVIWINRESMFSRVGAVTEVLPSPAPGSHPDKGSAPAVPLRE